MAELLLYNYGTDKRAADIDLEAFDLFLRKRRFTGWCSSELVIRRVVDTTNQVLVFFD